MQSLSRGHRWTHAAIMVLAIFGQPEAPGDREKPKPRRVDACYDLRPEADRL